jgi:uncharacterized damage-inducible protein DinB
MDQVLPYRAMAYNNGWANHRLPGACAGLSQAELVAPRVGFFPSLRAAEFADLGWTEAEVWGG